MEGRITLLSKLIMCVLLIFAFPSKKAISQATTIIANQTVLKSEIIVSGNISLANQMLMPYVSFYDAQVFSIDVGKEKHPKQGKGNKVF